jgi:hypothetical protein
LPSLGGETRGGLADRDRDGIVARKIRTKDGVGYMRGIVTACDRESIDSCATMLAAIHRHAEMRD